MALKHLDKLRKYQGRVISRCISPRATIPHTCDPYSVWPHNVIKTEYSLFPTTSAPPRPTPSLPGILGSAPRVHRTSEREFSPLGFTPLGPPSSPGQPSPTLK